jgi:molecular chaperone DnaK
MSRLSFTLNLPTEKLKSLDLSVEIRKPNMALVKRTLASKSVEVEPGNYYITATLPAGQEISNTVKVGEGLDVNVVLTLEPDDDLTHEWSEAWPYLSARGDIPTLSKQRNVFLLSDLSFPIESEPLDSPHEKAILTNLEVEAASRPRGSVARSRVSFERKFVRRGVEARLLKFFGNMLEENFTTADQWETTESESNDLIQLTVEGDNRGQLAQLLQPNEPAVNITLPAWAGESCELALTRLPNGRFAMEAHLTHPTANLLMRYLEQGLWQHAADVVESAALSAQDLLYQKRRYPIAAAIGAYALLRFGELERLHDWTNNLKNWFKWLPDGICIRGEHLALLGQHEEALEVFCELPERGLPYFSDGLSYAVNRLRLYTSLDEKPFKADKLELAVSILKRLETFVPFVNFRRPVLTYTGVNPSKPDAVPVQGELATYGGLDLAKFRTKKNSVLGIDLGNSKSAVAVIEDGEPVVIEVDGSTTMPSVVGFTLLGGRLVGEPAKQQFFDNSVKTIASVRDFVGQRYKEVEEKAMQANFAVLPDKNDDVRIFAFSETFTPQEILAMIVRKLKRSAESYLGQNVTQAVISIPSYFSSAQRQAIKETCEIAGLEVLRMSNQASLAALALKSNTQREGNVAILNLGGGALDISILKIGTDFIKTLATASDVSLGGDDIDERVVDWILTKLKEEFHIDLSVDRTALQHLRQVAEKAKIELSEKDEIEIEVPLSKDAHSPRDYAHLKLTRGEFELVINDLLSRLSNQCDAAWREAKLSPKQIDEVVLVGGSARIPKVERMVEKVFGRKPTRVNADELAAIGAAIQGAVLSGEREEISFIDVLPLSLGIETLGGVFTRLIERNSTIPTRKSEIFSTASDNQTSVEVHVLQGERPMASDNRTLGKFHLVGILPAPRGMPQVEVTFHIDANGIVNVSAKDMGTGREQKITITASSGLSKAEIDRMMRDAESHASEDQRKREEVEERNRLDGLIYQVEKTFNENREKVDSAGASEVESAIAKAKKAAAEGDTATMNSAFERLQTASHKLAEAFYQQSQASVRQTADASEARAASGSAEVVGNTDYASEESSE